MPLRGKQPHERVCEANWRRSLCAAKRPRTPAGVNSSAVGAAYMPPATYRGNPSTGKGPGCRPPSPLSSATRLRQSVGAGHARPLQTAVNGSRTRGAREGGSPAPFPLTGCRGRLRAAYMPPLQRCCSPLRGFGGAWRRTTSAASLLRKHARAVVCPAGANIARSPVSLRSTVAPGSQPRNTRLKSGGRADGVKNGQ